VMRPAFKQGSRFVREHHGVTNVVEVRDDGRFVWNEQSFKGAVRQTSPSISIHMKAIFYEVTKERHSLRAASRFSLNVLRFESDLCELNRL
jgi:hypothetical protein